MSSLIRFEGRQRIIFYKRRFIPDWILFDLKWIENCKTNIVFSRGCHGILKP